MGLVDGVLNFVGGFFDRDADRKRAHENQDLQREFAQNGIRWKVEDANAAGIHPLAAMGAQTTAYQPAFDSPSTTFAEMGQNLGRAIDSTRTGEERTDARIKALQIERGELENDLLRSQIAQLNTSKNPPMPNPDGPNAYLGPEGARVLEQPTQMNMSDPKNPSKEAGVVPSFTYRRNEDGSLSPIPAMDAKNRQEDSFADLIWSWQNNILPNFGSNNTKPPASMLPKGYDGWEWSLKKQAWVPIKSNNEKWRQPDYPMNYQYKK